MATTIYPTVPVAQPEPDPWPVDDHPLGIQADEMFARQLDTEFAGEVRALVHDPEVGLAGQEPEEALIGIAEAVPKLDELKERYLAQAIGQRQRSILEPLIDRRLERATGEIGRLAQQATTALDDRIVAERLVGLGRDAALAWHDPAHLRLLGRSAVNELRYQGERRGWDETQTATTVRRGLSDLYAGAVEQAIGQDLNRAAKLYDHTRDVIQPERQAAIDQKMDRTREERRVTDIVSRLSETPDDPARRPDLDDYLARAAELTPPDASPETRAEVVRMSAIEHARADRAWQAARGRAAVVAVDWLGKNPAAPLLAMPATLRDGLSPEQTGALDRAAINGGRVRTVADLYGDLAHQAAVDPERFVSIELDQYRLSLSDADYGRLAKWQSAIELGQQDDTLVRLARASREADSALAQRGYDLEGLEAKRVRADVQGDVLEFDVLEGRPANREDLDDIVNRVVEPLVAHQTVATDAASLPSDATSKATNEITLPSVRIEQTTVEPKGRSLSSEVTTWLMGGESDGQRRTERPPPAIWNQLTTAQREAVDILLAQNAIANSDLPAKAQLVSDFPDAANENTRNYVCTEATYTCLSNAPSGEAPTWRTSCMRAESLCNRIVNLSRISPFPVDAIINFPDRSRVTVPKGSKGHGQFTPAPQIPR